MNTPTFPVHEVWHLTASSWKNKIEDANAVDVFILKEIRVPMMSRENLRRWWIACLKMYLDIHRALKMYLDMCDTSVMPNAPVFL